MCICCHVKTCCCGFRELQSGEWILPSFGFLIVLLCCRCFYPFYCEHADQSSVVDGPTLGVFGGQSERLPGMGTHPAHGRHQPGYRHEAQQQGTHPSLVDRLYDPYHPHLYSCSFHHVWGSFLNGKSQVMESAPGTFNLENTIMTGPVT